MCDPTIITPIALVIHLVIMIDRDRIHRKTLRSKLNNIAGAD